MARSTRLQGIERLSCSAGLALALPLRDARSGFAAAVGSHTLASMPDVLPVDSLAAAECAPIPFLGPRAWFDVAIRASIVLFI
jgi:hypothetical protein